jgi:hypothetical protein
MELRMHETGSSRAIAATLVVAGVVIIVVALGADVLGFGREPGLGLTQILGAGAGVLLVVGGALWRRFPPRVTSFVESEVKRFAASLRLISHHYVPHKRDIGFALAILTVFFVVYFSISTGLATAGLFRDNDTLFGIDARRAIDDMAVFASWHYRTAVHPSFVLLVNPFGLVLNLLTRSPEISAIVLNSVFGALGVALAFLLLKRFLADTTRAALLGLFFGFCASQLFLSIIPDTETLATVSLIATYMVLLLSLHSQRRLLGLWILAGAFSLAVVATNLAQVLICYLVFELSVLGARRVVTAVWRTAIVAAGAMAIVAALSWLQQVLYPAVSVFSASRAYAEESAYVSLLVFQEPVRVLLSVLSNLTLLDVISPYPQVLQSLGPFSDASVLPPSVSFTGPSRFGNLGWVAVGLWACLLALSLLSLPKSRKPRVLLTAAGLCMLFNLSLHSFYGVTSERIELFLYSGNFAFLVIMLVSPVKIGSSKLTVGLLGLLAALVAANNITVVMQLPSLYRSLSP